MKQHTSLEDERRALLEQIHSSREVYRRMLTKSDKQESTVEGRALIVGNRVWIPRSLTMRWILQHPYAITAAVAAVGILGSRTARTAIVQRTGQASRRLRSNAASMRPAVSNEAAGRRTARTRSTDFAANNMSTPRAAARSIVTGIAAAAAMLLRDPRKMQAASNAFSAATRFIRERRARYSQKRPVRVGHIKEG